VKFHHDLPRNFVYEKCRQQTQLSVGCSYGLFRHTVWLVWRFKVLLQIWTGYGQIGLQVFVHVIGPQNVWDLLGSEYNFWRKLGQLSMTTQTHVFVNRSNGYGRLNTAHVRSSPVAQILFREVLRASHGFGRWNVLLFRFALLSLLIRWLNDATHPNYPHHKKRNDPLLWIIRVRWHKRTHTSFLSF
jgi:hypothetical protein